jgi:hypothetical protein
MNYYPKKKLGTPSGIRTRNLRFTRPMLLELGSGPLVNTATPRRADLNGERSPLVTSHSPASKELSIAATIDKSVQCSAVSTLLVSIELWAHG